MMMMMASRPKLSEAAWYKRFKKNTNPRPTKNSNYVKQIEQTLVKQSSRDDDVIFNLDSYSKFELKQLKEKFMSKIERIEGFVKQIEACELELLKLEEDVNSKNLGQKRVVQGPDPLNKRRRLVKMTTELNSVDEMRKCGVITNFRNPLAENAEKPVQIHPVEALPKKSVKKLLK
ncbi:hypothetical protein POM88_045476 [Heracleum sosnowskyi]|uniref:Uncharacterized protein n=1 Tax=Heracleum sosnowskyi TaxID=360622 RepID=A0AAD8H7I7_9APIA|nr:hypothetical protein POM88_045476 [Heracleum sosnowskyi]